MKARTFLSRSREREAPGRRTVMDLESPNPYQSPRAETPAAPGRRRAVRNRRPGVLDYVVFFLLMGLLAGGTLLALVELANVIWLFSL